MAALSDARGTSAQTSRATLPDLKTAFFAEWSAAVDGRGPDTDRALILDARVFRSPNALGWSSREAAGVSHRPTRMSLFLRWLEGPPTPVRQPAIDHP